MLNLDLNEELVGALIRSTNAGLQMAGVTPKTVGVSKLPARAQETSVVIGLVGRRNGTVTLNLSERAMLFLANKLMDTDVQEVDEGVFDAVGEITNILAGRLKAELSGDEWKITNISCPSIVIGGDYRVYHFRGFTTVAVEFELEEVSTIFIKDRVFTATLSLSQN